MAEESKQKPKNNWRWLVDAYDQSQKLRIAMEGRGRAVSQGKDDAPNLAHLAADIVHRMKRIEEDLAKAMERELVLHPAWPWLEAVHGIGPILACRLVGAIDFTVATTPSKLWRYCGLGVVDGHAERRVRGQVCRYNHRLKAAMYLIGTSFLRSNSPYRQVYDQAKQRYYELRQIVPIRELLGDEAIESFRVKQKTGAFTDEEAEREAWNTLLEQAREECQNRNPSLSTTELVPWTDNHVHLASLRKMTKIFLLHLWLYTRRRMGLPVRQSYAHEFLRHHPSDEYEFVSREEVERNERKQARRMRRTAHDEAA